MTTGLMSDITGELRTLSAAELVAAVRQTNDAVEVALQTMGKARVRLEEMRAAIATIEGVYRARHKGALNDYVLIALHNASLL